MVRTRQLKRRTWLLSDKGFCSSHKAHMQNAEDTNSIKAVSDESDGVHHLGPSGCTASEVGHSEPFQRGLNSFLQNTRASVGWLQTLLGLV